MALLLSSRCRSDVPCCPGHRNMAQGGVRECQSKLKIKKKEGDGCANCREKGGKLDVYRLKQNLDKILSLLVAGWYQKDFFADIVDYLHHYNTVTRLPERKHSSGILGRV